MLCRLASFYQDPNSSNGLMDVSDVGSVVEGDLPFCFCVSGVIGQPKKSFTRLLPFMLAALVCIQNSIFLLELIFNAVLQFDTCFGTIVFVSETPIRAGADMARTLNHFPSPGAT